MTFYKIVISGDNWQHLNKLYSLFNEKTEYKTTNEIYLNIGNSMLKSFEVCYFNKEHYAREIFKLLTSYYFIPCEIKQFNCKYVEVEL